MKKHYRKENNCLNCGTILEGKYCHNCGQENLEIKESFGHMMNHAISDYFHFDHQFFHTLKPLLFKPGFLTTEYMAGRRVQYLHPIKMYIFISIVYFLLFFKSSYDPVKLKVDGKPISAEKIIDSVNTAISKDRNISATDKKRLQLKEYKSFGDSASKKGIPKKIKHSKFAIHGDTTYNQYLAEQAKLAPDERDGYWERFMNKKLLSYYERYGSRAQEVFIDELKHNIPKMMFLLLPIFALILKVAFWKNKKYYVEHLIYTFHLHSSLFLSLAIIMILEMIIPVEWGLDGWLNALISIYIIWYIYRSLRVVYQRSRFRTITKMMGMSYIYSVAFIVCLVLIVVVTALTLT